MNGFLIINKPDGYTSRDIVNMVSKKFNTRRVGHVGTLDPMARGVLIIAINNATKTIPLLENTTKEYIAEVILGIETDTLDITGKVVKNCQRKDIKKEDVVSVLNSFIGKSLQEVPIYSAVKIKGKKLYEYARNNEEVTLPKREIEVFNIELLNDLVYNDNGISFTFKCKVSKGTYIRSLIRDIAYKLNTYGTMKSLIRTKQGNISIENSINILDIDNNKIVSIEDIFDFEKIIVNEKVARKIRNGQILDKIFKDDYAFIYDENNNLLAIYEIYEKDKSKMKPYTVFGGKNVL